MSSSFAAFWLDARLRLATPAISTLFCVRRPGMCLDRVLAPAPMIPMRSVSVAMVGFILVRATFGTAREAYSTIVIGGAAMGQKSGPVAGRRVRRISVGGLP